MIIKGLGWNIGIGNMWQKMQQKNDLDSKVHVTINYFCIQLFKLLAYSCNFCEWRALCSWFFLNDT
jgi:hypothetical protein